MLPLGDSDALRSSRWEKSRSLRRRIMNYVALIRASQQSHFSKQPYTRVRCFSFFFFSLFQRIS